MKNNNVERSNLLKVFLGVFFTMLIITLGIYFLFGFQIAIICWLSLGIALIWMWLAGIENIMILLKDK